MSASSGESWVTLISQLLCGSFEEIMRAGPNADAPRFKTYLTHRVVDGRVVAEQHAA